MKTPNYLSLITLVMVAFFYACQPGSTSSNSKATSTDSSSVAKGTMMEQEGEEEPEVEEIDLAWYEMDSLSLACGSTNVLLGSSLLTIANRLEAKKLMYDQKPFTDCSGIFHRVLDSLGRRCPEYTLPDPATHRSSRGIAEWYHEQGDFIQIKDPVASAKYIKPGAVMFYASGRLNPDSLSTEQLFNPGGIRHIGVVVEVQKEEDGTISSYTLFHGRSSGKIASKTDYHDLEPSRSSYPAYGNGRDHWVGVAPIAANKMEEGGDES